MTRTRATLVLIVPAIFVIPALYLTASSLAPRLQGVWGWLSFALVGVTLMLRDRLVRRGRVPSA